LSSQANPVFDCCQIISVHWHRIGPLAY